MASVSHFNRIQPPQALTLAAFNAKFAELNTVLRDMQEQLREARGLAAKPVVVGNHLDMGGMRITGVGRTRHESEVASVGELREEALYARDGVHRTDRLILARGGVRTVTPAVAPNDLITKGQVEGLITDLTGAAVTNLGGGPTVTTIIEQALSFPQATITLANGLNSNIATDAFVFIRIVGPTLLFSIGGFDTPADGRFLIVFNASGQDMTIVHNDASTVAASRIDTVLGGNLSMTGNGITLFIYSIADSRWLVI